MSKRCICSTAKISKPSQFCKEVYFQSRHFGYCQTSGVYYLKDGVFPVWSKLEVDGGAIFELLGLVETPKANDIRRLARLYPYRA